MAHKKHRDRVPPGNKPRGGPAGMVNSGKQEEATQHGGAPFAEQDPKRRLGDYEGAGEHSIQEPGGKNDANH